MLRTSALSMGLRGMGVILALSLQALLANLLGVRDFGYYSIVLSYALLAAYAARLAADEVALRFATHYADRCNWGALRGLLRFLFPRILAASLLIALVSYPLVLVIEGPGTQANLALFAVSLVFPLAALALVSVLYRSFGMPLRSQLFEQLVRPLLLLLMVAAAILAGFFDLSAALLLTVVNSWLVLGLAWFFLRPRSTFAAAEPDRQDQGQWSRVMRALFLVAIAQEALNQLGVIMLGWFAMPEAAGQFAVVWRLCNLLGFALAAVGLVSGPMIARAHGRGDFAQVERIAVAAARYSFAFALIASLVLGIGGRLILSLFGDGFAEAYPALLILLAGGLINSSMGVVGYCLSLTGAHSAKARIHLAILVLGLASGAVLIPVFGLIGAAIAFAMSQALLNLAMMVTVERLYSIRSFLLPRRSADPRRDGAASRE